MKKTSYYKQYFIVYFASLLLSLCGVIFGICFLPEKALSNDITIVCFIIWICFVSMQAYLFSVKRFDLVKKYYEEKVKKD